MIETVLAGALGVGVGGGGGAVAFLRARAQNRRDDAEASEHREGSAKLLAEAYGVLVDDLREDIADLRKQRDHHVEELRALRGELHTVVAAKDAEITAMRLELANERAENGRLRERVTTLEAEVRKLRPA